MRMKGSGYHISKIKLYLVNMKMENKMVLKRLSIRKTYQFHNTNVWNIGVNLKIIGEMVLGLNPIKMETFILDS